MLEQTLSYSGYYFVLMGRLSPLDGIGPDDLHIQRLLSRVNDGLVSEVILATNFTAEGEATAHYLGMMLKRQGLKVSRLAGVFRSEVSLNMSMPAPLPRP